MTIFSQRDKRWANKRMGQSNQTLGRSGCTTTCIAMLSTYFGDNLNPAQTCDRIKYDKNGLILWSSSKFNKFKFWFREYRPNHTNIKNALAGKDTAVILQVANGSHWVVATGNYAPKVYTIADPWDASRATTNKYNNITGAAYFQR